MGHVKGNIVAGYFRRWDVRLQESSGGTDRQMCLTKLDPAKLGAEAPDLVELRAW
jgi:hypothetical protein